MKSFAATLIAVTASSASAFAPANGSARASTSLNSHFSSIETQLFNKATLLKALNDMGIKSKAAQDGDQIEARGYKGETIMADIVIPQQNNYDVAFRNNGESYELVTDLQFWQQSMPVDAFMERVNQRYAINNIIETTGEDGFNVDNVVTAVDGTVTMELSRYAFN
mmetsp:Transcript_13403/g.31552  ORF Transcript_13403/g.31552 Transcript_13403/m.31552 type:complete len:166 (+) Transcript_13403:242-739(+)|eukprot:CAMPEP_0197182082 /NCGR_PEP_ID=MMETSP1423-20130617/6161_1 /TAXON_ID=476441 /ORGANISM="Pseudo-nitzschia heimii, Strain UNC1101" /LENGTH=165 /DNA_ID=CAMNT_0042632451 /DNA_START=195 /DNA_END=692 /DNA_ORIENTATION=-